MDCNKCPIQRECRDTMSYVLSFSEELRQPVLDQLNDFCPLAEVATRRMHVRIDELIGVLSRYELEFGRGGLR